MHTTLETLPALVQVTAQTHIGMVSSAPPGLLAGYYIVGSAALGAFRAGRSDVDFVAVTGRSLRGEELERLKGIHASLHNKKLLAGLDGLYVPAEALAGGTAAGALCARFNEGRFHGLQSFDPASVLPALFDRLGGRVQKAARQCEHLLAQMGGGLPLAAVAVFLWALCAAGDGGVGRAGHLSNILHVAGERYRIQGAGRAVRAGGDAGAMAQGHPRGAAPQDAGDRAAVQIHA